MTEGGLHKLLKFAVATALKENGWNTDTEVTCTREDNEYYDTARLDVYAVKGKSIINIEILNGIKSCWQISVKNGKMTEEQKDEFLKSAWLYKQRFYSIKRHDVGDNISDEDNELIEWYAKNKEITSSDVIADAIHCYIKKMKIKETKAKDDEDERRDNIITDCMREIINQQHAYVISRPEFINGLIKSGLCNNHNEAKRLALRVEQQDDQWGSEKEGYKQIIWLDPRPNELPPPTQGKEEIELT